MRILQKPCLFLYALVISAAAQTSWREAARVGDDVYFFEKGGTTVEQYDLADEEWKSPIALPTKDEPTSAFFVDESGIYAAYQNALYRYDLSGENERFVLNQTGPFIGFVDVDDYVVAISQSQTSLRNRRHTSIRKSDNSVVNSVSDNNWSGMKLASLLRVGASRLLTDFSSNESYLIDPEGTLSQTFRGPELREGARNSPVTRTDVVFSPQNLTFLIDQEGRVFDNLSGEGNYFNVAELGLKPVDVIFRGEDTPVVLEQNRVLALSNTLETQGQSELGFPAKRLFEYQDAIFVFGGDDDDQIRVEKVPLADLSAPEPNLPFPAETSLFEADYVFQDGTGIINIFSRQFANLYRWDPTTQTFLETYRLSDNPVSYFYSSTLDRFYFGVRDHVDPNRWNIQYLQFGNAGITEGTFASWLGFLQTIANGGSAVVAFRVDLESGSGSTLTLYDSSGGVIDEDSSLGLSSSDRPADQWDPLSETLYFRSSPTSFVQGLAIQNGELQDQPISLGVFGFPLLQLPDQSKLLTSSGQIADLNDLTQAPLLIGNAITDATAFGDLIATVRTVSDATQVQTWDPVSLEPGSVIDLRGEARSITPIDENSIVVVSVDASGRPSIDLLNEEFMIVPPPVLQSPSELEGSALTINQSSLTWRDVTGDNGYRIERRLEGEDSEFEIAGMVPANTTTFTEGGLAGQGSRYQYRVVAINGEQESAPSEPISISFELPAAVEGFSVAEIFERGIDVRWQPSTDITSYQLQARQFDFFELPFRDTRPQPDASSTFFSATGLSILTPFEFRIRGINQIGSGPWTSFRATTLPPLPEPPNGLRTVEVTASTVSLSWLRPPSGEVVVERSLAGTNDTVEFTASNSGSALDEGLQPLTRYDYRIKNVNIRGESEYSPVLQVTTTELLPPGNLQISSLTNIEEGVQIRFRYAPSGSDRRSAEKFIIRRSQGDSTEFETIGEVLGDEFVYVDPTAVSGFRYTYAVVGENQAGVSIDVPSSVLVINGECVLNESFNGDLDQRSVTLRGGEITTNGASDDTDGGILYFAGSFIRSFTTTAFDMDLGGSIELRYRLGDEPSESDGIWDRVDDNAEHPVVQYRILDDAPSQWQDLGALVPADEDATNSPWQTLVLSVPNLPSEQGVIFRVIQDDFDGPNLDVWALDQLCIFGHRFANQEPTIDPSVPLTLVANPAGDPIRINFSQYVNEEDFQDHVYFELEEVSNPAIFADFKIDRTTGVMDLTFAPQASGTSTVTVNALDSRGGRASHTFTVRAPVLQAPDARPPTLRRLANNGILFSFDAVIGRIYQVQYSEDMRTWTTSPVRINAVSTRAQWLDQGPPETDRPPFESRARFYRFVPVSGL